MEDGDWGTHMSGWFEFHNSRDFCEDELRDEISRIELEDEIGYEIEDQEMYVFKAVSVVKMEREINRPPGKKGDTWPKEIDVAYEHHLVSLDNSPPLPCATIGKRWGCITDYDEVEFFATREEAETLARIEISRIEKEKIGHEIEETEIIVFKIVTLVKTKKKIPRPPEEEIIDCENKDDYWPDDTPFLYEHMLVDWTTGKEIKEGLE